MRGELSPRISRALNSAFGTPRIVEELWRHAEGCLSRAAVPGKREELRVHHFFEGLVIVCGPEAGEFLFEVLLRNDLRKFSSIVDGGIEPAAETELRLYFLRYAARLEAYHGAARARDVQISVETTGGRSDYKVEITTIDGKRLEALFNHRYAVNLVLRLLSEMERLGELPRAISPDTMKALKKEEED